ncbi:unnamed protein product [Pleuronectes platessa]|uniref:Uncharacterized protein n=1 Tax=Pleuronectes platessa TaxID=8262 RepID=A0A9N7V6F9_PLEPL|nr:unnamed protein product [Pleuronectes platessa]
MVECENKKEESISKRKEKRGRGGVRNQGEEGRVRAKGMERGKEIERDGESEEKEKQQGKTLTIELPDFFQAVVRNSAAGYLRANGLECCENEKDREKRKGSGGVVVVEGQEEEEVEGEIGNEIVDCARAYRSSVPLRLKLLREVTLLDMGLPPAR